MYAVLVLLFRSFSLPVTILTALPLAIGGAFAALLLWGGSISLPSLIGILMLMGIAAKNSILFVDYALESRKKGMERRDALLDAGHKRARPIIMTSVAMGVGMLPIAMGWGADVEFRSPMAQAVVGGLVSSTLLSLLYVPVAYTFVDDIKKRIDKVRGRLFANQGRPEAEPVAPMPMPAE
jgi:HAE1 family hydrophobic/amphiphilic exporter-1